jgi:hypothetical protein
MADIRMGDRVIYKDPKTNKTIAGRVNDITIDGTLGTVYSLTLDNGTKCTSGKELLIKTK